MFHRISTARIGRSGVPETSPSGSILNPSRSASSKCPCDHGCLHRVPASLAWMPLPSNGVPHPVELSNVGENRIHAWPLLVTRCPKLVVPIRLDNFEKAGVGIARGTIRSAPVSSLHIAQGPMSASFILSIILPTRSTSMSGFALIQKRNTFLSLVPGT